MKTYDVQLFSDHHAVRDLETHIHAKASEGFEVQTLAVTEDRYGHVFTLVMVREEPDPKRTEQIRRTFQAALDALNAIDDPRCLETGLHTTAKHQLHQLRGLLPDVLARPEGSEPK